jgi:HEAT repeat protein
MEDNALDAGISEKDIELAGDIFKTITKTVKTFNVYPKDNPIYKKFASDLFEKFNAFFESNEELAVDIEQYSLLYKGKEVFHSEDKLDNIALLLFADGLRQLTFYKGITSDEITDFIDVMRIAPKSDMNDDDDIVTLLWGKNIMNMGYTTAEDTVNEDRIIEESLLQDGGEPEEGTEIAEGSKSFAQSVQTGPLYEFRAEQLTDEEIRAIKEGLREINEDSLLSSAVALFFEVIADKDNAEVLREIVLDLGKIMDIRMKMKDIRSGLEILAGLGKISSDGLTEKQNEAIRETIDRAGSPESIRTLFEAASDNSEIRQYLVLLGKRLIPNMLQVLGELEDRKQRRFLCEVLAGLGKEDISAFGDAIEDARWYLVRNLAMIMGMTRNPSAVKHIAKVLKHPELRVRREAARALDNIHSDETREHLLDAINDEDFTVRIIAIKSIRRFRDPDLFEMFKKYVSREDLKVKSFDEKREMLETYAVLGGERAFPLLSDLFRKKGMLEKDETTEIRASAAYGLGLVGSPEALSLVEREKGSRKSLLREACINILRKPQ